MLRHARRYGIIVIFLTLMISTSEALRCYVCDSTSDVGYFDAEKDCNTETSLRQCPDNKHKACMIEAFRHEEPGPLSYHIIKRCLIDCPVAINGSAEHTRCCVRDECNEVISIDVHSDPRPLGKSLPSSSPGGTTAPAANIPSSRRLDPPVEHRSGPPSSMPAEPTSSDQPASKLGGPASSNHGPPGQSSRPSHASGDSFNMGGRPMGDPSHHSGFNHNSGGRGGPPPMLMMTTHTASPTLVAPGTGRHGDGGPAQRSRTSGQSVSGATGKHVVDDVMYATLAALCSTVGLLLTSFVNRS